jgi:hypothetical protein
MDPKYSLQIDPWLSDFGKFNGGFLWPFLGEEGGLDRLVGLNMKRLSTPQIPCVPTVLGSFWATLSPATRRGSVGSFEKPVLATLIAPPTRCLGA